MYNLFLLSPPNGSVSPHPTSVDEVKKDVDDEPVILENDIGFILISNERTKVGGIFSKHFWTRLAS